MDLLLTLRLVAWYSEQLPPLAKVMMPLQTLKSAKKPGENPDLVSLTRPLNQSGSLCLGVTSHHWETSSCIKPTMFRRLWTNQQIICYAYWFMNEHLKVVHVNEHFQSWLPTPKNNHSGLTWLINAPSIGLLLTLPIQLTCISIYALPCTTWLVTSFFMHPAFSVTGGISLTPPSFPSVSVWLSCLTSCLSVSFLLATETVPYSLCRKGLFHSRSEKGELWYHGLMFVPPPSPGFVSWNPNGPGLITWGDGGRDLREWLHQESGGDFTREALRVPFVGLWERSGKMESSTWQRSLISTQICLGAWIFRMMRNTRVFWRPLRPWWGPGPFKCTKQKLVAHPCRSSTGCWLSLGFVFWRARWEGGGVTLLIPALLPFQQARLLSLLLTQLLLRHR